MKSSLKRLTKQATLIKTLLSGSNSDMVTNELNTLEKTYGEFGENYARACAILGYTSGANEQDEDSQTEVAILMEEADSKYLAIKEEVVLMAFLRLLVTDQEMNGRSESPIQTLVELMKKSLSALWI